MDGSIYTWTQLFQPLIVSRNTYCSFLSRNYVLYSVHIEIVLNCTTHSVKGYGEKNDAAKIYVTPLKTFRGAQTNAPKFRNNATSIRQHQYPKPSQAKILSIVTILGSNHIINSPHHHTFRLLLVVTLRHTWRSLVAVYARNAALVSAARRDFIDLVDPDFNVRCRIPQGIWTCRSHVARA